MLKIKPGDDIRWAGQIARGDVTDFTGYTLTSQIRRKVPAVGQNETLLANASITWVNAATGAFLFEVPRASTADWPANAAIVLDVRVASPDNKWTRTETAEFMTEAGVTEGA